MEREALVLGMMSGTSLDGLDLCLVRLSVVGGKYRFAVQEAQTLAYSSAWKKALEEAHELSGLALWALHLAYGRWLGEQAKLFLKGRRVDLISSHGHTVFHVPAQGICFQLGHGAALREAAGEAVVCDFRSEDVWEGGQGAPLVPVADALLFPEYEACLNVGGISNASWVDAQGLRRAGDLIPANLVLNGLAGRLGYAMDRDGLLAAKGQVKQSLLARLEQVPMLQRPFPRSFGREEVEAEVWPLLEHVSVFDALATAVEWMGAYIGGFCAKQGFSRVLVTGGGAHHGPLLACMGRHASGVAFEKPSAELIDFKEAVAFALLGWLRKEGETNVWAEVTGSRRSASRGQYWPV